ncbi:MAG: BatA domain-containing protein [Bacteroidia bacterium]|nr:BatA domain-containing protein [Bacteroidia bacterium]
MAFLNPAVLWGLLALSVPIIVHFFNLQRPKEVLFSNVSFVKEVKKTVVRRVKFKQWLLLLARLLALLFLVFAFANPVIKEQGSSIAQGNRSVSIVIDNSYSMNASNEKGAFFPQALSLARNIIRNYSEDDEFQVMTSSNLILNGNFLSQQEATDDLKSLKIQQSIRSHGEILAFQKEIFARSSNSAQVLYFLSDFQESTVLTDSQKIIAPDSNLQVYYLPLATREQSNVYVKSHNIDSRIIEKDAPVNMTMSLVNDGNQDLRDLSVRIMVEGKVAGINSKDLAADQSEELEMNFTPEKSGWLGAYIELDDNPIDFDNKRFFSVYVPDKEKVLIAEGERSESIRILYESLFSQFDTEFVSARNLSTTNLTNYRSLVLLGVTDISSGLANRLRDFLDQGNSLMFFPGKNTRINSINTFYQQLGIGTFEPAKEIEAGVPANQVELLHPIFEGIFTRDQKNRQFDAPQVFKYYPLRLRNGLIQNRILSLENQEPILVESEVLKGRVFTFSIFPSDEWSDLHVKTIFTPLLFRSTQIMNQSQRVQSSQEIGFYEPKFIRTEKRSNISLIGSDSIPVSPDQIQKAGGITLVFDNMELKEGIYDIVQEGELIEKIAFNISDLESQLTFLRGNRLEDRLNSAGLGEIEIVEPDLAQLESQIKSEREGVPLWKYFIIAALAFFLIEILLLQMRES